MGQKAKAKRKERRAREQQAAADEQKKREISNITNLPRGSVKLDSESQMQCRGSHPTNNTPTHFTPQTPIRGHGPRTRVFHVEASPVDPAILVSTGEDATARVWLLGPDGSNRCQRVLRGHKEEVLVCGFSPDGELIATGGNDNLVHVWDNGRMDSLGGSNDEDESQGFHEKELARLKLHDQVYGCSFVSENRLMTAAGESMSLWDLTEGRSVASVSVQEDVKGFVFGGERNEQGEVWIFETSITEAGMVAAACTDGFVRVYDARLRSPKPLHRLRNGPADSCAATSCCFDAYNGTNLACAWGNGWMSAWDLRAGRTLVEFAAHESIVYKCRWWRHSRSDEGLLVSASRDKSVRLWELQHGTQHGQSLMYNDVVLALAVSPLQPYLAFAGGNGGYIQKNHVAVYQAVEGPDPSQVPIETCGACAPCDPIESRDSVDSSMLASLSKMSL